MNNKTELQLNTSRTNINLYSNWPRHFNLVVTVTSFCQTGEESKNGYFLSCRKSCVVGARSVSVGNVECVVHITFRSYLKMRNFLRCYWHLERGRRNDLFRMRVRGFCSARSVSIFVHHNQNCVIFFLRRTLFTSRTCSFTVT